MKALLVLCAFVLAVTSSPAQDKASLQVEREFFLPGGPCATLRYSPDGRWLAAGGELGDVALLDAESGALHARLEAGGARVGALRFSADGEVLAVCGQRLTLWRVRDGAFVASMPCASVSAFDWSRDGQRLAIVSSPGRVQVLRAADLGVEREIVLDVTPAPRIDALALDALGQQLAVGVGRGELQVFDVRSGEMRERRACDGFARGLAWLDDGRLLCVGSGGSLAGLGGDAVVFSGGGLELDAQPDGRRLLVQSTHDVLRFGGDAAPEVLEGSGPAALHPDGVRWVRGCGAELLLCADGAGERVLPTPNRLRPGSAVLSGDGRWLVVRGLREHRHEQVVFDVASGAVVEAVGLPAVGALLPDRQGLGIALLRGFDGLGDGDGEGPRLEFWRLGDVARRERSVAVRVQHPAAVRPSTELGLSGDGRTLLLGRELVDLLDATRSSCSPVALAQQVVVAGDVMVSRFALGGLARVGDVVVHDRCDAELARVSWRNEAPLYLAVAPGGDRLLVCLGEDAELRSVPDLDPLQRLPWRWRRARWIDVRHVLGDGANGLQLGDVQTGAVGATLDCVLGGVGGCLDFDAQRGLAVVLASDRVLLVRVTAPPLSPPATGGYLVVRVDLDDKRDADRGFLAAAAAAQQRHAAATFDWDGTDYDALAAELRRLQPENVLFVLRPELLDVVRHRRILLLASKLDDDWFVDCAFGYLTGADGDACERFWQRIEQRRERGDASRAWAELSVASMDKSLVYRDSLPPLVKAAGFAGDHYYFGTTDPNRERLVAQALEATDGADVLHFSGNGDPEGIWLFPDQRNMERDQHWPYDAARVGEDPDGAMPRLMAARFAERSWRAPIVWSGTCHSGAVDRVFVEGDIVSTFGRTERVTVHRLPEGHSLALAWLEAGAAALLVPIAANHGMSASMEIDFALQHGASLGEAVKSSWDDVLLQAEGELALELPVEGEPHRHGREDVMQGGGANRVLLGDPALRPFAPTTDGSETVVVERRGERGGVVTVSWAAGWHWRAWDMFGTDSARDWRVLARVDAAALGLEGVTDGATLDVQVRATGDGGGAMPFTMQRCALERHAGKVWLHLQANAPRAEVERKAATVRFVVGVR